MDSPSALPALPLAKVPLPDDEHADAIGVAAQELEHAHGTARASGLLSASFSPRCITWLDREAKKGRVVHASPGPRSDALHRTYSHRACVTALLARAGLRVPGTDARAGPRSRPDGRGWCGQRVRWHCWPLAA